MNLTELQRKLIQTARANPPSDAVPYAFEKRVMAHLKDSKPLDALTLWARAFTRSAVCCVLFMSFIAAGTYFIQSRNTQPLSQEVEQSLFAAADNGLMDQDIQ